MKDTGRVRPSGSEGSRPNKPQWPPRESPGPEDKRWGLCPWSQRDWPRAWEPRPGSPCTLWAGFCFSWQILISLYFDHTVATLAQRAKLNSKLTREERQYICVVRKTPSLAGRVFVFGALANADESTTLHHYTRLLTNLKVIFPKLCQYRVIFPGNLM